MSLPPAEHCAKKSIFHYFADVNDPRINRQKKHKLEDIFFITICAVISGADNWVMVENYGKSKKEWLTEILGLENGIPSHDTFGYVFAAIDNEAFSHCFSRWVASLADLTSGEVIAIDGKALRRSLDKASKKSAIHMVSAWAQQAGLVLGQVKVDSKSNEITAIPKLLELLDLEGAIVTIDAMGCQKSIAKQITERGGDYVLSLKGNQSALHDDVTTFFDSHLAPKEGSVELDKGHGRIETRTARVSNDIDWLKERHPEWSKLNSILAVTATRDLKDRTETETRYFISSLDGNDPEQLRKAVRAHWAVENSLHWVLDVAFDEDRSRARAGNSAANLAIIRHVAVNLIKNEKSTKVGVKTKRAKAGWDNDYLLKVMGMN